jgi:hypothetical protein
LVVSSFDVPTEELVEIIRTTGARPTPVFDCILAIEQKKLPDVMRAHGFPERTIPKTFLWAGEVMPKPDAANQWPVLLVAGAASTSEFGTGHLEEITVNLTCAWPVAVGRRERQEAIDVAYLARDLMRHPMYAGRFEHPDQPGMIVWGHCLPIGGHPVPVQHDYYGGYYTQLLVRQFPNANLWARLPGGPDTD